MNLVRDIKKIIGDNQMKIEIFSDEIIFTLYEIEIPIIYVRDTQKVVFKPNYLSSDYESNNLYWDIEIFNEVCDVMKFIDENKDELKSW